MFVAAGVPLADVVRIGGNFVDKVTLLSCGARLDVLISGAEVDVISSAVVALGLELVASSERFLEVEAA